MDIHVSLVGRKDLAGEIYRQLRQAILDGRLRPGDRLPATRELARRLSVSRTTVTVAYDRLSAGGLTESRVGAGTFVKEHGASPSRPKRRRDPEGPLRGRPEWERVRVPTAFDRDAVYDFRSGIPDARLFPHATWRRLVSHQMRRPEADSGKYGDPAGDPGLREAIARHVGVSRGVVASPEDVLVTNGTQQAMDVLARVLTGPGDRVGLEDPGYPPIARLFESRGVEVVAAPVDGEGVVSDGLPDDLRLVYTTPSHQYPLGMALSLPRRVALLAWAERADAAIVEDDYDSEFRFGGKPIEPLRTLDDSGRVIYVGSFSKTMLPSLRLGFVIAPPSLRDALRRAKFVADWHTPLVMQRALAAFIDDGGFATHVRRMNRVYERRHRLLLRIVRRELAEHLEAIPSDAGLHVCAMARRLDIDELGDVARRAAERGVAVQQLRRYRLGGTPRAGLVLGYGGVDLDGIREGLALLRSCFP